MVTGVQTCALPISIVHYKIYGKKGKDFIISGYVFWLILTVLAVILDVILSKIIPQANINFFYLSPLQDSVTYPVLNLIFKKPTPYPMFLLSFVVYYTIGVVALYGILTGIDTIKENSRKK